jgi:hypothetical protein
VRFLAIKASILARTEHPKIKKPPEKIRPAYQLKKSQHSG